MEYKSIKLEVKDGIAYVTVDRPKAMNAINESVMSELGHVFGSEGLDTSEVKGVILTGAGDKAFVAGADITQFNSFGVEEGFKLSKFGHDVYNSIERYPIPVIAAINGYSLGGGNELAMSCHMRICSDNAKFGQPEVNLGLLPGYGGTQRLIQYIGKGRAMELLLTGDMIDAAKALEYGLVTHVCPLEDLMSIAEKLINKISSKGPAAVSMTIRAVNAFFDKSTNGFAKEMDFFGKAMGSDECTEGVTAFLEKRKPNFRK